jgi:hypothetical protein
VNKVVVGYDTCSGGGVDKKPSEVENTKKMMDETSPNSHGGTTCRLLRELPYGDVRLILTKTSQENTDRQW